MRNITILTDCDGILTTPYFVVDNVGTQYKNFSVNDSLIVKFIKQCINENDEIDLNIDLKCITGAAPASLSITSNRVQEYMGIPIIQCSNDKKYKYITENYDINEIFYIGDDIYDLPILEHCKWGATVKSAPFMIQNVSRYISPFDGGQSAFTDIILKILSLHNIPYEDLIRQKAYSVEL